MTTYSQNGTIVTSDSFLTLDACEKDDLLKFTVTPSRSFVIDKGLIICNPDISTGYKGVWDFDTNETVLVYNPGTSYESRQQIQTLTDKQLVLVSQVRTTGTTTPPATRTTTFTAF